MRRTLLAMLAGIPAVVAASAVVLPVLFCKPRQAAVPGGARKDGRVSIDHSAPQPAGWVADPFAGTVAIDVRHAGRTYRLDRAEAVAEVLRALKVGAIWNDVGRGSIPPAGVTFHRADGSSLDAGLENDAVLSVREGLIFPEDGPRFVRVLGRVVAGEGRPPVNLLQRGAPGRGAVDAPRHVPASDRSLTAGFRAMRVNYLGGPGRLRVARITDPAALEELHQALQVVRREPNPGNIPRASREFTIESKDGSAFQADILAPDQFLAEGGLYTVRPAFVEVLNRHLGRIEGRPINVLGENPPAAEQTRSAEALGRLIADTRSIRIRNYSDSLPDLTVDEPEAVAKILAPEVTGPLPAPRWYLEAPGWEAEVPEKPLAVELTRRGGEVVRIVFLETGSGRRDPGLPETAGPLGADLVRVHGPGQLWLDGQWKYRFQRYAEGLQQARRESRRAQLTREVMSDPGSFLPQVISVNVGYRRGDARLHAIVPRAGARPVIDALEIERVEKLNWSEARWRRERAILHRRGAGSLALTPGVGFSLEAIIAGERELLVPPHGRVLLKRSLLPAVRAAVADAHAGADGIGLVPSRR